ncbi:MAG: glycosyltransferase [Ruminococcus sp.]|nr:glycosyltransferase [Ruminococcus sp.]
MEPLVSVIIPVYNMDKFVKTCVDSVMSQTYSNVEIVLVNDGSKDNSYAVCKEIAKNNPKVLLINQENQGVSVARNNGIKQAKGEYVTFLDADDYLFENALQLLVETAQLHNADMTMGRLSDTEVIPVGVFEGEQFLIKALEDNPITYYSCRILYRREFLKGVSFPKGFVCGEDSYFVFECALKKPKVATISEQVYFCYPNPNSATRSAFTEKRYNDVCELLSRKEALISSEYPQLLPLFYHLKTKIQMMLLTNLCCAKGAVFRRMEKETLARFREVKGYFRADLLYSNASLYNILSKNLYFPYKVYLRIKVTAKRLIKK